jgi:hypothetical protein
MPSPRSYSDAAVVLPHGAALARRGVGHRAHVGGARHVGALREVVHRRRRGRSSPRPRRASSARSRAASTPSATIRSTVAAKPEGVPGLEGPELPVVAPAHGVIDGRDVVADLAHAPRRVRRAPGEHLPREAPRGALRRRQHGRMRSPTSSTSRRDFMALGHLGGAGLLAVVARRRVERLHARGGLLVEAPFVLSPRLLASRPSCGCRRAPGRPSRSSSSVRALKQLSATWAKVSRPTMSAVRKAALLGRPMGVPTMASTSSGVSPSASIWWMAAIIAWAPMRLPMKLVVSFATTMPLPSTSAPKRLHAGEGRRGRSRRPARARGASCSAAG